MLLLTIVPNGDVISSPPAYGAPFDGRMAPRAIRRFRKVGAAREQVGRGRCVIRHHGERPHKQDEEEAGNVHRHW
jgi:hypothetical protein